MSLKLCLLASLALGPLARAQQQEDNPPAGPKLWFYTTRGDCYRRRSSMQIGLHVDDEVFQFKPSCHSVYQNSFITKSGASCQIDSPMCSTGAARSQIQVVCTSANGGVSTSEDSFSCPTR